MIIAVSLTEVARTLRIRTELVRYRSLLTRPGQAPFGGTARGRSAERACGLCRGMPFLYLRPTSAATIPRFNMKLLVVEDDRETASYLVKGLGESGYTVDRAGDGREGLFMASAGGYDAIVLDRMLPAMDGLTMLSALRAAEIGTPALILSALGTVDDRVKGLRAGGDDYLVKPFAFSELLARLEALLRRGAAAPATTWLRVADLELDLLTRTVRRGGKSIELLPREFRLLEYL